MPAVVGPEAFDAEDGEDATLVPGAAADAPGGVLSIGASVR